MTVGSRQDPQGNTKKRPRFPSYVKIEKRPLLRPPISSPYTSSKDQKIIYLKRSTPFISIVKRVRNLLAKAEKRAMQAASSKPPGQLQPRDTQRLALVNVKEEVFVKATGRAIYRALEIAWFFQQQKGSEGEFTVRVKTGSVSAVDDIIEGIPSTAEGQKMEDVQTEVDAEVSQEDEDLPETRLRQTSSIEVAIGFK